MRLFTRFVAAIAAFLIVLIFAGLAFRLWLDLSAGSTNALHQFEFDNRVNDVAFSPDGQRIAVVAEGYCRLHIFDTDSGRQIQQMELCPDESRWGLSTVTWSPDGERIVVTRVRSTDIWIVDLSGNIILQSLVGHSHQAQGAIYSHDGQYIATYDDGGVAVVWDAESGQPIHHLVGTPNTVTDAEFSPDDRTLATSGSDGVIRLWDVQSGDELESLTGHESTVFTLAFSADGRYLASGGIDNTARVWRVEDSAQIQRYENPSSVMQTYFLDDSIVLFSNWIDGRINLWNIETNEIAPQFNAGVNSELVDYDPAQALIATTSDYKVELWEIPISKRSDS